jgi:hypothetical protein
MENRKAIHIRNIVAAVWIGFGAPTGCVWILIGDRNAWLERHRVLALFVFISFVAPLIFVGGLELIRRRSKNQIERHDQH